MSSAKYSTSLESFGVFAESDLFLQPVTIDTNNTKQINKEIVFFIFIFLNLLKIMVHIIIINQKGILLPEQF